MSQKFKVYQITFRCMNEFGIQSGSVLIEAKRKDTAERIAKSLSYADGWILEDTKQVLKVK